VRVITIGLLLLLTLACDRPEGETITPPDATWTKLARTWVAGTEATGAKTLTGLRRGARIATSFGNPGGEPVTLRLDGFEPAELTLPPYRWTHVRGRAKAVPIEARWSGGPVLFGPVHQAGERDQPSVLLVSIDTLRADMLDPEYMPQLAALAQQGRRFTLARTPTPWTLPAHVSLLTGQYPNRHGVRLPDQKIPAGVVTLAEAMTAAGYHALAVTEGNYVSATFGFTRGFAEFHENPPSLLDQDPMSVSKLASSLALLRDRVTALTGMSRFAFFHTYEVHCPYLPRAGLSDPEGLGGTQWLLDNDGRFSDAETYAAIRALYRGEVAYTDEVLTPFLEELVAGGDWIVVVTSDHGEEFGEHGGLLHADTLYEETMRVPLVMIGPGIEPGIDEAPVSIVDVATTLARLVGIAKPERWQGRDLMDPNRPELPIFGETHFLGPHIPAEDPRLAGVWQGTDKLIQTRSFGRFDAELYDLAVDPGEQTNRQATDRVRRDALFIFLTRYLEGRALEATAIEGLSPEQIETMRSLGYIK